jgi:hypothetical protein
MSAIPPNWLASILQSQGAQRRAAEAQAKESADAAGKADAFAQRLQDVIENSDRDSEVFADAEGSGGSGRDSTPPDGQNDRDQAATGDSEPSGPPPGVDLEA